MAAVSGAAPIECPYVTDGLIFWLDGINQGGVTGEWKDLIGGKIFTLTNCTQDANSVYFNGSSSYGRTLGAVSSDWSTETIELAQSGASTTGATRGVLYPVNTSPVGIGMAFSTSNNFIGYRIDGISQSRGTGLKGTGSISINGSACVVNGVSKSQASSTNYYVNTSEYTYLGVRFLSAFNGYFKGKMHSLRIYNRRLSVAEMQHNQAIDVERFGISY